MIRHPDVKAAERFIWLSARLIDRHRYACLFKDGPAEAVVEALRPYQNPDGGFGNALEPDARGAPSQPAHVQSALLMLAEVGKCGGPMVERAIDYLTTVTGANGGVPMALPSLRDHPRAPWWEVADGPPVGTLLPTAGIVGPLLRGQVEHPWIAAATRYCWDAIGSLEQTHPYEIQACLGLLDAAPDRARAESEAGRVGRLVHERRLVLLDPEAPEEAVVPPGYAQGELHTPLDYAPTPISLARRWFSDRQIERALDALAAAQADDGGWPFNWRAWNPATTIEWRGAVTVRVLTILRAYGRLD